MEDGGFTLVKKGGRNGGRPPAAAKAHSGGGCGFRYQGACEAATAAAPAATLAALQQQLDVAVEQLEGSGLWKAVRATLHTTPVTDIVCLGVGSFGSSASARYQLALALLLRRELLGVPLAGSGGVPSAAPSAALEGAASQPAPAPAPPPPPMDVYDPVLGDAELALLRARALISNPSRAPTLARAQTLSSRALRAAAARPPARPPPATHRCARTACACTLNITRR